VLVAAQDVGIGTEPEGLDRRCACAIPVFFAYQAYALEPSVCNTPPATAACPSSCSTCSCRQLGRQWKRTVDIKYFIKKETLMPNRKIPGAKFEPVYLKVTQSFAPLKYRLPSIKARYGNYFYSNP
jgi:hypothetical protein